MIYFRPAALIWLAFAWLAITPSACSPKAKVASTPLPSSAPQGESSLGTEVADNEAGDNEAGNNTVETVPELALAGGPPPESAGQLAPTETAPETEAEVTAERLLLLAVQGPLVVDIRIRLGAELLDAPYKRFLDSMLRVFDANEDGKTSWDELTRDPRFAKGEFGTEMIATEKRRLDMIEQNDFNRDKLVSQDEISRLLSRDKMSSRSLTVRSSNDFRETTTRESPTRQLLDEDGDGRIDSAEIDHASVRLQSRDVDDDELIFPTDLSEAELAPLQPVSMARRKVWAPDVAMTLGGRLDWDRVFSSLQETYALGGPLDRDSLAGVPELFQALDTDGNGKIGRKELEALLQVEPDLRLDIAYEPTSGAPPSMTIQGANASWDKRLVALGSDSQNWLVNLPDLVIRWECADRSGQDDSDARAEQLIKQYDLNQDGYIDKDEIPDEVIELAAQFRAADEDGDGMVYAAEVATYLRRQRGVARYLVRVAVAFQPDSLFVALDTNADGRLDFREILAASARLRQLDANDDGRISNDEIPVSMRITIVRGETGAPAAAPAASPVPNRGSSTAAPWFRSMDLNGDGAVSRREFLGELDTFVALDANQDGFLEWAEVQMER